MFTQETGRKYLRFREKRWSFYKLVHMVDIITIMFTADLSCCNATETNLRPINNYLVYHSKNFRSGSSAQNTYSVMTFT